MLTPNKHQFEIIIACQKSKPTINCFMFYYIMSQVMACSHIWLFNTEHTGSTSNIWKPWQLHTVSESRWSKITEVSNTICTAVTIIPFIWIIGNILVFTYSDNKISIWYIHLPCVLYNVQLSVILFTSTPWFSSSSYTHVLQYIQ